MVDTETEPGSISINKKSKSIAIYKATRFVQYHDKKGRGAQKTRVRYDFSNLRYFGAGHDSFRP